MSNNIDAKLATDLGKATHLLARALQPLMEQLAGWASCRMILRNAVPTEADASVGFPGNGQVIDPALGLRPGQHVIQACLLKTVSEVLIKMPSSSQVMVLGPNGPVAAVCQLILIANNS